MKVIPIVPVGRAPQGNKPAGNPPRAVGLYATPGEIALDALPPLSVYVHWPWCVKKCPYCDFNSHESATIPEADYINALRTDLESALPLVWGRRVKSVFIGGGTPSLMSASAVDSLLATLRSLLPMEADAEITLEANPGTVEAARFAAYAASGINRLSLGIQSFNATHLKALGRIHDSHEAQRAAELALKHFSNVNFDLMYALPQQTPGELAEDLRTAISFNPQHLSVYHLTLEPNTYFAKFPPKLPDDDAAADMQAQVEETLASHVYARYETSAYARAGEGANTLPRRSVHNTNYWLFGDYLGIGAGAHGKLSFPNRIVRQVRARTPSEYLRRIQEGTQVVEDREVKRDDLPFEFMMNALRLTDGFDASLFHARTGLPLAGLEPVLRKAEQRGLITRSHATIAPTQQGRDFLNDLLQIFL